MLIKVALITISFGEENTYPLGITIQIYPKSISYGDVCFLAFFVTNQGTETLLLPIGVDSDGNDALFYEENKLISFHGCSDREWIIAQGCFFYTFYGVPVKPGETMKFHARMTWLPLPEIAFEEDAKQLLQVVNTGEDRFTLRFNFRYHAAYAETERIGFDENGLRLSANEIGRCEGLTALELSEKRPEYPLLANFRKVLTAECNIRIQPRPQEEIELLQNWFLELPSTSCASDTWWRSKYIFAQPYHVRGSPFKMETSIPSELRQQHALLSESYREFFSSIETRTPELLARIERTNELAAKIVEQSKQPGSTISRNMVEFIQLRSFLVAMRYADNSGTEQAAFDSLVNFVENAHYKDLWLKFIDEIGFAIPWLANNPTFPNQEPQVYQ